VLKRKYKKFENQKFGKIIRMKAVLHNNNFKANCFQQLLENHKRTNILNSERFKFYNDITTMFFFFVNTFSGSRTAPTSKDR